MVYKFKNIREILEDRPLPREVAPVRFTKGCDSSTPYQRYSPAPFQPLVAPSLRKSSIGRRPLRATLVGSRLGGPSRKRLCLESSSLESPVAAGVRGDVHIWVLQAPLDSRPCRWPTPSTLLGSPLLLLAPSRGTVVLPTLRGSHLTLGMVHAASCQWKRGAGLGLAQA
jgi:hypothetical protein